MSDRKTILETEMFVLRKTPYGETSLIIAGLTPTDGLVSVLVRGARKVGRKSFPVVDIFRRVSVLLRQGRGELFTLTHVELLTDYGAVAIDRETYATASWLARFSLQNIMPGIEHPEYFQAMLTAFLRLRDAALARERIPDVSRAVVVGTAVAYLKEAGWLDHYRGDPANAAKCEKLIEMSSGRVPVPDLKLEVWDRLRDWALKQLRQVECHVPVDMGSQ